jgi:CHAT domain-containing protein
LRPLDPKFDPLPEASKEAKAVASLFGRPAVTGRSVTRKALLTALRSSRRIHIATHGQHEIDAPIFQCFYIVEGTAYAPVYAYEILNLDLRHVDLITLSACETALGRFDTADNLRGLPASLLVSGVRTIIGTLWKVESTAADTFFTVFYKAIQGSTKLEAFAEAQQQTRLKCPQYRDWGCFYMVGDVN